MLLLVLMGCGNSNDKTPKSPSPQLSTEGPVIVLHGGAGSVTRERLGDSLTHAYQMALDTALQIGWNILKNGGEAIDAVEKTIVYMENNPLFNAGKGSVLNSVGEVENDASIMNGSNLAAGAVAGIKGVKNPIVAARLVKDSTKHVLLSGSGAMKFLNEQGVEKVEPDYFMTPKRKKDRAKILNSHKHGTVGVAALDKNGNLAAGTSTGGMHKKKFGRVGDSPIIGAGTYADNATCAISCTGHGEYFIKNAVAYDMSAQLTYTNKTIQEAAHHIIHEKLKGQKALGGLIGVDRDGNVVMDFNTEGMFRAYQNSEERKVEMFGEK